MRRSNPAATWQARQRSRHMRAVEPYTAGVHKHLGMRLGFDDPVTPKDFRRKAYSWMRRAEDAPFGGW